MINDITEDEYEWLMKQPNSLYDRLPAILDCIIGMNIMVVQNINKPDHIIHGTYGRLEAVLFEESTIFKVVIDKYSKMKVRVPNKPPLYLLIQIEQPTHKAWPNLSRDIYPIGYNID